MNIRIEYCVVWNYKPRALSLREDLFLFGSAELIPSDRGAFEVFKDGELLFSKLELDRFPNDGEIANLIQGI